MAKTKISEWSTTPASNTDIDGINIAEGCAPSGINDAIRDLMAQVRSWQSGASGDPFNGPMNGTIGATTAYSGAFTTVSATGVITSTLATGTAPFTIASTTKVTNLNADLLDGADWAAPASIGSGTPAAGAFTTLSASGAFSANGGATLGDASGDALTINSSAVSIPNGLNFDSNTFVIDATNNRVGINTASPVSPLHVVGAASITGTIASSTTQNTDGQLRISNTTTRTSGNQYGIRFADSSFETNASIYVNQNGSGNNAADLIFGTNSGTGGVVLTSATERMRITSTGNVGIGTSSPNRQLSLTASSEINSTSTVYHYFGPNGTNTQGFVGYNSNGDTDLAARSGYGISFKTVQSGAVAETMRLTASGNLGLGVTPSAWSGITALQLNGNASLGSTSTSMQLSHNTYYNGTNWIYNTTAAASNYYQSNGSHIWRYAASGTAGNTITFTQAMTLDASGNLIVGGTTPVYGSSGRGVVTINGSAGALLGLTVGGADKGFVFHDGSNLLVSNTVSASLLFQTGNTERARIDSSGNLLVGTNDNSGTAGAGFKFKPAQGGANAPTVCVVTAGSTGSTVSYQTYSTTASAYRFYVDNAGTIYATSTSISAISDQTLKTNVRDLETGITEVMALKPRRFDWKNGDATNVAGFIAQEVAEVLPELVSDYQYSDVETKKSLKMGDILPTLVKAIQEQQAIIESLKARLDAANL